MSGGPFKPIGSGPGPEPDDEPPPARREPPPPKKRSTYNPASTATWIVGVMGILIVLYITVNSITTEGTGSRGVASGEPLPSFTAPLALANTKCPNEDGDLEECDANVQLKPRNGVPTACDVNLPETLNVCRVVKEKPLVLAFMVTVNDDCIDQVDILQKLAPRYPDVQFAAVAIRGDHSDLNKIIREHNWTIPVAYDHDGAVANIYAVAICPTITFARKGGIVQSTSLKTIDEAEVIRRIEAIRP